MRIPRFENKADAHEYIKANRAEIIKAKKSEVKALEGEECSEFKIKPTKLKAQANKAEDTDSELNRTIVGNTYYWLDQHDDVHVKGTFTKSISENVGKIPHRHDHINQVAAKVGIFSSIYEGPIRWKELGIDMAGSTISVFGNTTIKQAYNSSVFEQYKDGEIDQHSVGMIYMDLIFCSDNPDDKEDHKNWTLYHPQLGNKEKATEQGYFFVILQAKLIEISCVTRGSNPLTPTMPEKAEILESIKHLVSKEIFIALQSALDKNEPLDLTLDKIKPQDQEKKDYYLRVLKT